ncbi:hypothetical protein JG687_00011378 [Phytophthora cactorum]|uniref:Uncharacterized protein n=1 Tax=Phytophthora cactorum TaxID=29920 RepID=A0A8T1U608_9STRA|nr:hypothetical protein JG687_00011378 [Phytophthora cactorum]
MTLSQFKRSLHSSLKLTTVLTTQVRCLTPMKPAFILICRQVRFYRPRARLPR